MAGEKDTFKIGFWILIGALYFLPSCMTTMDQPEQSLSQEQPPSIEDQSEVATPKGETPPLPPVVQPTPTSPPTPNPTPTPTPTPRPSSTPVPTPNPTPQPSGSPTPTPQATVFPQVTFLASRTTCVAPCAVFFDATYVQHPSPSRRAFHDLDFVWDFGDSSAQNWITDQKSKNRAYGAVVAHVFEHRGTYNVTLSVRDAQGNSGSHQQSIQVEDFDTQPNAQTLCVSQTPNDLSCVANNGAVGSVQDFDAAINWLFSAHGPRRILFKRGETFTNDFAFAGSKSISNRTGPYIIGAYGSGAKPKIETRFGTPPNQQPPPIFEVKSSASDIRIMDLNFEGLLGKGQFPSRGLQGGGPHFLLLRTEIRGYADGFVSTTQTKHKFVEECVIENNFGYNIFASGYEIAISGNRLGNVIKESIMRIPWAYKAHFSHNRHFISSQGVTATRFATQLRVHGTENPGQYTQFVIVSDNFFSRDSGVGNLGGINLGAGNGANPDGSMPREQIEDILFERNEMTIPRSEGTFNAMGISVQNNLTVRNNIAHGPFHAFAGLAGFLYSGWSRSDTIRIYNNTFYAPGNPSTENPDFVTVGTIGSGPTTWEINNNIAYTPKSDAPAIAYRDPNAVVKESHNLLFNLSSPLSLDPKLADAPNGNLQLSPQSLNAIDQGLSLPSLFEDYENILRAPGTAPDIGAYEY